MGAQTKVKLDLLNLSEFLPGYNEDDFESTMSYEETEQLLERFDKLWDQGKEEEAERVSAMLPVEPGFALTQYVMLGKEGLLSAGLNLKDAEKAYGSDWLDRFEVGKGYIRLKKTMNG